MPLTILSDSDVRTLLHSLTRQDIHDLQQSLADALHYYSTSTTEDTNGCCSSYQPMRTALKRSDGQTTLFMPASSNDGLGVKIVTLLEPGGGSVDASPISSFDSLSLSSTSTPSASSSNTAFDVPADIPPSVDSSQKEITAFRTALASTMLFKKRTNVHDLVVFGAGKQAYWHIRLALLLRGPEIHHLNIINRTFDTAHALIERLYNPSVTPAPFSTINVSTVETADLARPKISILTPSHNEYARLLKSTVRASSIIFCTTPSLVPLFPAEYLTNTEGRKKGRYIAAIGSYKAHMVELHPDILRQAVAPQHGHHHHKHAQQGGAVVVDSVEACLKEAGEIIQAGLGGREVVEVGELVMLKRDAERRRLQAKGQGVGLDGSGVELGGGKKMKGADGKEHEADSGLTEWLQRGNVIYKSVGLGLMDVVVGGDLVRLADERGVGTIIENF
ncbi:NAD(P)-binding protein [Glonium stellatum]|uniref:NAD(P)-binding protein n=1 Tax=Glonium stellatum TaxID=574774 RepID=A0A8E2EPZ7_9PEZI|nr:NAD(P)-binding protein [Glonium stellatum]